MHLRCVVWRGEGGEGRDENDLNTKKVRDENAKNFKEKSETEILSHNIWRHHNTQHF